MTAITTDEVRRNPLPLGRVLAVARVHLANWAMALGFPLAIMGTSFFANLLTFGAIGDGVENPTTGGLASLYVVQFIVCWQGLHQTFTFAVGLNATRRALYAAALLVGLGQSLLFGIFLYICANIERATGGWGLHVRFFDPLPVTHSSSPVTIAVYAVPLLLVSTLGLFLGTVAKRWGSNGVLVLSVAVILVVGGLVALVFYLDGWPAIGHWLASRSWLSIIAGWTLVPAVLAAAGGWLVLRRAVP